MDRACLDALRAFDALSRALGQLRGEPLDPKRRPEDDLTRCGLLAEFAARHRLDERAEGGEALWVQWRGLLQAEPGAARQAAVVLRGWGLGYAKRHEGAAARRWLTRAAQLLFPLCASPEALAAVWGQGRAECSPPASLAQAWAALPDAWLDEHASLAQGALERRAWDEAALHWGLVVELGVTSPTQARRREVLVGALFAQVERLLYGGLEAGEEAALRLLEQGLKADPGAELLQRRRAELVARAGRRAREAKGQRP